MNTSFSNKTVLITGASRGIGRAIALYFAREGSHRPECACRLVLNCHTRAQELEQVRQEIAALQIPVFTSVGDVGDYAYAASLCQQIRQTFGSVDILINNAGISKIGLFSDLKPEEWNRILSTNLTSVYNLCSQCIPDMVQKQAGSIITISSVWGLVGASCEVAYSASKAALWRFTECISFEKSIDAAVILPGFTDTDVFRSQNFDERSREFFKKFSMNAGRMAGKIVNAIKRGKHRKIIGVDAYFMHFGYKFFPRLTPFLVTKILKKASPEAFGKITN